MPAWEFRVLRGGVVLEFFASPVLTVIAWGDPIGPMMYGFPAQWTVGTVLMVVASSVCLGDVGGFAGLYPAILAALPHLPTTGLLGILSVASGETTGVLLAIVSILLAAVGGRAGFWIAQRMDFPMRLRFPDICPVCTYPLTGLPPHALCPECGAQREA